jgi:hypothetical protein
MRAGVVKNHKITKYAFSQAITLIKEAGRGLGLFIREEETYEALRLLPPSSSIKSKISLA